MAQVTHSRSLISLNQVSFHFENGYKLFDSINLSIDHARTAIAGRNGMGKSVLARLIAGELNPTSGFIERYGSIVYVGQGIDAQTGQTVAQAAGLDAVLSGLQRLAAGEAKASDLDLIGDRWDIAARLRESLDEAGLPELDFNAPVDSLSGGQRIRIALTGALIAEADLLILDEPSNHLDRNARNWLRKKLANWKHGLVVVSHDREMLHDAERIIELTPHGPRIYGGNYTVFRQCREAEQLAAQAALEHARTERARERERLQREHDTIQRRAAGARRNADTANVSRPERYAMKNAAVEIMGHIRKDQQAYKDQMHARVQAAAARVTPENAVLIALPGTAIPARKRILTLNQVRLPWLDSDDPAACLDWSVEGPARIAVTGPNGCGKSTLLRVLAGDLLPVHGNCSAHVSAAYLDQWLTMLGERNSIVEQLGLLDTPLSEGALRSRLALLQIDAQRATQAIGKLSGGERLKAALACALWRGTPAQLLLLDEPTNHLDLESIIAFEQALLSFPGAIVAVSHDADFLRALRPTHTLTWTSDGWIYETVDAVP